MKTTKDVLGELDAAFAERQREEREAHARSRRFIEGACNAGLVDDVQPSGPPPDDVLVAHCGHCGADLTGPVYGPDTFTAHARVCRGRR